MARAGIQEPEDRYLVRLLGRVNYQLQITPGRRELLDARALLLAQRTGRPDHSNT